MPIRFECDCGRQYNVAEKNAGRKIRCADCGETVTIPGRKQSRSGGSKPRRQAASDGFDEYDEYDEYDDGGGANYDEYDDGDRDGYDGEEYDGEEYAPRRRSPKKKRKQSKRTASRSKSKDEEKSGGAMMGSGALMVVGGGIWLVVGLMGDRLFFYPIILIVLGIASFFKGLIKGV
jgi:hypothetical protein